MVYSVLYWMERNGLVRILLGGKEYFAEFCNGKKGMILLRLY